MNKLLLVLSFVFLLNGCSKAPFPFSLQDKISDINMSVSAPKKTTKKLKINALDTIVPQRSKEKIMRGVMLPYQADGIMHDSSYVYLVIKHSRWMIEESVKVRNKRVLGGINGN